MSVMQYTCFLSLSRMHGVWSEWGAATRKSPSAQQQQAVQAQNGSMWHAIKSCEQPPEVCACWPAYRDASRATEPIPFSKLPGMLTKSAVTLEPGEGVACEGSMNLGWLGCPLDRGHACNSRCCIQTTCGMN